MGDCVGDIVELEVEEDAAATGLHGLNHGGAFCREEFQSDLAEGRWLSKGIEELECSVGVRNIEGNDDFVLGSGRQFHTIWVF
jgi:hypothetical protein